MTDHISLDAVTDWDKLGEEWRRLEARSAGSFFQSWSWIGCLARERFLRPVVLTARAAGQIVALGLFNHRPHKLRDVLWLHETGDPSWDNLFIEYNGLLIDAAYDPALWADGLAAAAHWNSPPARRGWFGRRLILGGIDDAQLGVCQAVARVVRRTTRAVPVLDLAGLRRRSLHHLDVLSANTRAQLRRSLRHYQSQGPLTVTPAADADTAHRYLDALAALHQTAWRHRGKPGAFADPAFGRFHHALIDRGQPRGEIELLRMAAGEQVIGYLYNFNYRGRILAYQSGFDYAAADRHQKPGLTCHHLAIERSLSRTDTTSYDFLAGGDRYKRSLADGETRLHWVTLRA